MEGDHVSVLIKDDDIWEQIKARLNALEPVNEAHRREKFNSSLNPPPYVTAKKGEVDKFIEALKHSTGEGANLSNIIGMQGPSGNSLLHVAAGMAKGDILRALLEVIPDERLVAKVNYRGDTALHIAARAGRIDTAKLLLGYNSIVHVVNDAGNTALHEAVKCPLSEEQKLELTRLLLRRGLGAVYPANKESKCPLYLAVEADNSKILELLMKMMDECKVPWSRMQGMSPVHGAVMHKKLDMLKAMSQQKKELFDLRDASYGTPLHLAAHKNYVKEVDFLIKNFAWSAFARDEEGYLPIHVACRMDNLETVKELLQQWPDSEELLTFKEGQNILHVAAKYGGASIVKYILGKPELKKLINAKDKEGNTPLHVATLQWQPNIVFSLTRGKGADTKLVNNNNSTALDIVEEQLKKVDAPLPQSLTRIILKSAGARRSKDKAICRPKGLGLGIDMEPPDLDRLKDVANTRMVVATLVAAMTFAAGFSVPGGYNDSEPDAGIATLLNKPMYDIFLICNTVAMYSSIIAVVILLWTQINNSYAALRALRYAKLPLLIALATMSMAFMTGVYVTISKRTWIAVVALSIGIAALFVILSLYIALLVPLEYNNRLLRFFCDYIIKVGISISSSGTVGWAMIPNLPACFGKPDNKPKQRRQGVDSSSPSPSPPRQSNEHVRSLVTAPGPSNLAVMEVAHSLAMAPGPTNLAVIEAPHSLAMAPGPTNLAVIEAPHSLAMAPGPTNLAVMENPHSLAMEDEPRSPPPPRLGRHRAM